MSRISRARSSGGTTVAGRSAYANAFDVNTRLLTWATKRPHFKTSLFRFVDVFPACTTPHDVLDHLDEYLLTDDTPGIVRAGLGAAHAVPSGARAARRSRAAASSAWRGSSSAAPTRPRP